MMDAVYMHQNQLDDNKITHQFPRNGLVDARTMLDTEDQQDVMLDTEQLFTYQEEEDSLREASYLTVVDGEDDLLQFSDHLRGHHTAK
jgi:hypothetical protein